MLINGIIIGRPHQHYKIITYINCITLIFKDLESHYRLAKYCGYGYTSITKAHSKWHQRSGSDKGSLMEAHVP